MPLLTDQIRGNPLKCKPEKILRCGMSVAQYAQNRDTQQWFELTTNGNIIGSPLQLDFYRPIKDSGPHEQSRGAQKELVEV